MKTVGIISLLAFVACANAGFLGHPAVFAPVPVVKHVHHPVYAVHPPILAKPVVYAHHQPVVKVLHAPVPVVKHISYAAPVHAYGAYGAFGPGLFF